LGDAKGCVVNSENIEERR